MGIQDLNKFVNSTLRMAHHKKIHKILFSVLKVNLSGGIYSNINFRLKKMFWMRSKCHCILKWC